VKVGQTLRSARDAPVPLPQGGPKGSPRAPAPRTSPRLHESGWPAPPRSRSSKPPARAGLNGQRPRVLWRTPTAPSRSRLSNASGWCRIEPAASLQWWGRPSACLPARGAGRGPAPQDTRSLTVQSGFAGGLLLPDRAWRPLTARSRSRLSNTPRCRYRAATVRERLGGATSRGVADRSIRPSACPGRRKRLPHHCTVSSRSIRHHPAAAGGLNFSRLSRGASGLRFRQRDEGVQRGPGGPPYK
jgi:hypothetical protein